MEKKRQHIEDERQQKKKQHIEEEEEEEEEEESEVEEEEGEESEHEHHHHHEHGEHCNHDHDHDHSDSEGEVYEIDFGGENPSAETLYKMATEEKEGGNSRITSKLFELSIEKFEKMEKENMNDNNFLLSWAICLSDFGEFIGVKDFLLQSQEKFSQVLEKDAENTRCLFGIGKNSICTALILHEEAIEKFEEENEENEENIPEDQDFPKIPPTEEELKFLQTGIDSYQKGFNLLNDKQETTKQYYLLAHHLYDYAQHQTSERKVQMVNMAIDLLKKTLEIIEKLKEENVDSNLDDIEKSGIQISVFTLYGSCLSSLADEEEKNPKSFLLEAIEKLEKARKLSPEPSSEILAWLGNCHIDISNLEDDEKEIEAQFEKGKELLKKALELNPHNRYLKEQVRGLEQEH